MNEMTLGYKPVIENICALNWSTLDQTQLTAVGWAYYFFSIQFRENLQLALAQNPDDQQLQLLVQEECATDNLSPWTGVAEPGEKLNHDAFMLRVLHLSVIDEALVTRIKRAGIAYLDRVRQVSPEVRALSIVSYEDGGLESVFKSILQAPDWNTPLLQGFRHFLVKHISFDGDQEHGHGALIRHYVPDDRIRVLWAEFHNLLIVAVPELT
jgi:hypothetical protein